MKSNRERLTALMEQLTKEDCCIAFSGGVDSSLLLKTALDAAAKHHTRVIAVMFDTVLHPSADKEIAKDVAEQLGAEFRILSVNELDDGRILDNPVNRCYLCKHMLFERLLRFAGEQGISVVLEGTNHDDTKQYRPGIRAVEELGIKSPLREAGLSKQEVREWAAEYGITVADRPSTPCMATRLPYGTPIELDTLKKIEKGEAYLRSLEFQNVRLRLHGEIVRLEVDRLMMAKVMEKADEITARLQSLGFGYITLDLKGFRSGSMDENSDIKV